MNNVSCILIYLTHRKFRFAIYAHGFSLEICDKEMGMRTHTVPEESISASSSQPGMEPKFARDLKLSDTSDSELEGKAWSPLVDDTRPYLEVAFPHVVTIASILTQGDENGGYASSVRVSYKSEQEEEFKFIEEDGVVVDFPANSDDESLSEIVLPEMTQMATIRVYPKREDGVISMRMEFHGCGEIVTTPVIVETETTTVVTKSTPQTTPMTTSPIVIVDTTKTVTEKTTPVTAETSKTTTLVKTTEKTVATTTPTEVTSTSSQSTTKTTEKPIVSTTSLPTSPESTTPVSDLCSKVMREQEISTGSVQAAYDASSNVDLVEPASLDVNGDRVWYPKEGESDSLYGDYVEVKFDHPVYVTEVKTQGDSNGAYVKKYRIYSLMETEDGGSPEWRRLAKIFDANTDSNSVVTNTLSTAMKTAALRISVVSYENKPAFKFSVIGCFSYAPAVETTPSITETTAPVKSTTPVLVSTTVTETEPVVSTTIVTTSKSTEGTESTALVTKSTEKPTVSSTTTVTVSSKTPEVTESSTSKATESTPALSESTTSVGPEKTSVKTSTTSSEAVVTTEATSTTEMAISTEGPRSTPELVTTTTEEIVKTTVPVVTEKTTTSGTGGRNIEWEKFAVFEIPTT